MECRLGQKSQGLRKVHEKTDTTAYWLTVLLSAILHLDSALIIHHGIPGKTLSFPCYILYRKYIRMNVLYPSVACVMLLTVYTVHT